jgi:acetyl esterase/lipase
VELLPDPDAGVPYFEVHGPALGTSNRAVIAIHGGAWMGGVYTTFPVAQLPPHLGPPQTSAGDSIDDMTRRYTALGWTVYDVDYHSGGVRGLRELQAFYDSLRQSAPSAKVCTAGASAGAHLALMLAAHNPAIVCVVALAAPTDLHSLVRNGPIDVAMVRNGIGPDSGDLWRANSPVALLGRSRAATLLVTAADDHVVPWSQAAELEVVMRGQGAAWVQALEMSPGPLEFVHGTTNAGAVKRYLLTERCLLLRAATPGASCAPS